MARTSHLLQFQTAGADACVQQKFCLYRTESNFYIVGRDKRKTSWRVLKIDRMEPSNLNIHEDPTIYSESECDDLLKRIHEGNKSTDGLKFITKCFGIIGFVKFLGPHYMLLVTRRRKIGTICGHVIYAVAKSVIITIQSPLVLCNMTYPKEENRYKRLLSAVDLTKDFFFSHTYNIMCSLQTNITDGKTGPALYKTMFVWNEFLSRGILSRLRNTFWTVALVYGFFKQVKMSVRGKDLSLILIARRSRYFAGTRYLKRGVNENGRVANDVETEQIVFDNAGDVPCQLTSVVQNRGSIPLLWSQVSSWINVRPAIILHKDQDDYKATRLHFDDIVERYGNPIVILNLIKTQEEIPRESLLRTEFAKAIDIINSDLLDDAPLLFLHYDLNKFSREIGTGVLDSLVKAMTRALDFTGFLHCQITADPISQQKISDESENTDDSSACIVMEETPTTTDNSNSNRLMALVKTVLLQCGVLRTNCIDCLDRTNVAQYAFGLSAFRRQLRALGVVDDPHVNVDSLEADALMDLYVQMGDALALQYGGSPAHHKIFSERRGHWKPAIRSQELIQILQRYFSNTYMDAEKQDAINLFLGYFQPQQGNPSDHRSNNVSASSIMRSLSEGDMSPGCSTLDHPKILSSVLHIESQPSACTEIPAQECAFLEYGNLPSLDARKLRSDSQLSFISESRYDQACFSNFLDPEWILSQENPGDMEPYDRTSITNSSGENISASSLTTSTAAASTQPLQTTYDEHAREGSAVDSIHGISGIPSMEGSSGTFADWVRNGGSLWY